MLLLSLSYAVEEMFHMNIDYNLITRKNTLVASQDPQMYSIK